MATGQSLINRAMRLIGATASGEVPTVQESADALTSLTAMLESWRLERLTIYAYRTESLTLVPSQAAYTIGPTGGLNTIRPIKLVNAYVRNSQGQDSHVSIFTEAQWSALPSKSLTDIMPECLYYENTIPLGTLQVFPVPTAANILKLVTWVPLSITDLTTAVDLAPGYERAIAYNLALEIAPEFEKEPSKAVWQVASEALTLVKRANQRPLEAAKELAGLFAGEVE